MNIDRILGNAELRKELLEKHEITEALDDDARESTFESMAGGAPGDKALEAIVRRHGRPVLFIQQDTIAEPESELWKDKIETARANLEAVIPSIGRIEVRNHPSKPWLGTGWLITPEVLITNRHVAVEFCRKSANGFTFKRNPIGRRMRALIDFKEEFKQPEEEQFRVREILNIEEDDGVSPDLAFLRVSREDEEEELELPPPVPLSVVDPEPDQVVGVIGYAAWDGQRNDDVVMKEIFGGIYNVKRLHPGEVMAVHEKFFNHDCSTLGGNSGSPVIDFATGEAVGIHFAGSFELANYAVKASTIRQRMTDLGMEQGDGIGHR